MDLIKHISEWTHLYTLYKSNRHSDWISFLISGRCFTPKMLNKKAKLHVIPFAVNENFETFLFYLLSLWPLSVLPSVCDTFCSCYLLSLLHSFCVFLLTMLPFVYVTFCRLLTETWRTEFYRWILWWRHLAMPKLSSTIIPVDLENI